MPLERLTSIHEVAVAANVAEVSDRSDWVQLLPAGQFQGRDGRGPYRLDDADAVIAATRALGMDLPIDRDHQTDFAPRGTPIVAAGSIRELSARSDGLYGRVEWTDTAKAQLAAREYRYLSPVFDYAQSTGQIVRLLRAALTNNPNLHLRAVASVDRSTMPPDPSKPPTLERAEHMLVNAANMDRFFTAVKTAFNNGFDGVKSHRDKLAMKVNSATSEEAYGWLGQIPGMREWVGDRVIKNLHTIGFAIKNRDFESTVSVPRNAIADDQYGVFGPVFTELGRAASLHPDQLLFELLKNGFNQTCYDGQYFFDTDHPVGTNGGDYPLQSVSNFGGGSGTAWFLMDLSRAIKPLIWQNRTDYKLVRLDGDEHENVFMRKEFLYGVDGRGNAGYGLWQLAYASKQTLDQASYEAARVAMRSYRGNEGGLLGVMPTHLVVPPSLEKAALQLINAERDTGGASNVWRGTAELIVADMLG